MEIEKLLDEPFVGGFFYTCVAVFVIAGLVAYGLYRKAHGKDLSGKRKRRAWD